MRGLVTSGGANPKIYFSALGDTLILNYYGGVLADTATSTIRGARYERVFRNDGCSRVIH
ncbi:MAG: hypothetical protein IPG02_09020 [Ignavibacteria bacterium]|nr:hypothetical protein [Ignavibacteria bacterium]